MKRRIILSTALGLAFCISAFAQPSDAALKKQYAASDANSISSYSQRDQDWKIGNVKVNLFRTADQTSLTFEF